MGATQSLAGVQAWCCGAGARDERHRLQPGRRRFLNGRVKDTAAIKAQPAAASRPKPISVKGPAYTEGSLESKYELLSEIGHGGTSVVYRCQNRRTGNVHACKIIDRRMVLQTHNVLMEQFQVEIQVLQSMNHPNIIHIDDVYLTDSKICMVTEFMGGGELFDYIVEKGTLSELEASAIVRKITSAVAYMHACGVVHRDLKPENLMLTSKSRGAEVKIIDFGLAKLLDADNTTASFLGTRGYLAPEMLQRQAYTMSVDMWALGVIVYVLLCGCLPFNDDGSRIPNMTVARAKFGLRFPRWASGLSESAKDLLRHLLEVDATKRYTADQALAHPWVTGQRTPNQFLKSPNYLRTIKKERLLAQKTGAASPYDPEREANGQSGRTIANRRQSH